MKILILKKFYQKLYSYKIYFIYLMRSKIFDISQKFGNNIKIEIIKNYYIPIFTYDFQGIKQKANGIICND